MREILFRGKREDDGEWIYGSLLIETIQPNSGAEYKSYKISDITRGEFSNDFMSGYEDPVDPDTVGQYTGMTDKNGVKIFEGDCIVMALHEGGQNGIVTYVRSVASYMIKNEWGTWPITKYYWLKVIGNIYDNPELLEV